MRKLLLGTTNVSIRKFDAEGIISSTREADYKDLLITILSKPTAKGDYDEIRKIVPIMDKIEAAGDKFVRLEETEWKEVSERVKKFQFAIIHRDIAKFVDDVLDAQEIQMEEVKEASEE